MSLQRGDSTGIYNICSYKPTTITPPDYYNVTYIEANCFIAAQVFFFLASRYEQWKIPWYIHNWKSVVLYNVPATEWRSNFFFLAVVLYVCGSAGSYTHVVCVLANAYSVFFFVCVYVCYCLAWQQIIHSIFPCIWNVFFLLSALIFSPGLWCLSSEAQWAYPSVV